MAGTYMPAPNTNTLYSWCAAATRGHLHLAEDYLVARKTRVRRARRDICHFLAVPAETPGSLEDMFMPCGGLLPSAEQARHRPVNSSMAVAMLPANAADARDAVPVGGDLCTPLCQRLLPKPRLRNLFCISTRILNATVTQQPGTLFLPAA